MNKSREYNSREDRAGDKKNQVQLVFTCLVRHRRYLNSMSRPYRPLQKCPRLLLVASEWSCRSIFSPSPHLLRI